MRLRHLRGGSGIFLAARRLLPSRPPGQPPGGVRPRSPLGPGGGTNTRGLPWEGRRICRIKVSPLSLRSRPCLGKEKQAQEATAAQAGLSKQRGCSIPAREGLVPGLEFLISHPFPPEIPSVATACCCQSPEQPQKGRKSQPGGVSEVFWKSLRGFLRGLSPDSPGRGWGHPQGAAPDTFSPTVSPQPPVPARRQRHQPLPLPAAN